MSKEYFEKRAISASLLKALSTSPRNAKALLDNEKSESKALTVGSLVDCLLTTPDGFDEDYVVFNGVVPTDKMLEFTNEYLRLCEELEIGEELEGVTENELILRARSNIGYDKRLTDDTVIKKFKEKGIN